MKKKVVLAYSGGLDTSCAVRWIKDKYNADVICFSAFIGEVPNAAKLKKKALAAGASKVYIEDLKGVFAKDYILPALWAHARYEGKYLMATTLGRPLIAKRLVEIAEKEKAEYVAHGCSGKGNDQVRLEVGIRSLNPKLKIIAPLKEWEFRSREEEVEYADLYKIPVDVTKKSIYSIDKNIWGIAIEAGILEDPWTAPPNDAFVMTKNLDQVPNKPKQVIVQFEKGIPVAVNGRRMKLGSLIEILNKMAGDYGIGRIDMIENRLVGIKSREIYEAPAGTVLMAAHEELESLIFDRELMHYKRVLSEKYSELVYYGLWFSPLKEALDGFFESGQRLVTGEVKFRFEKGHATIIGRRSPHSSYSEELATYSKSDIFEHAAANGFIKLWGLPYEGKAKR
jgi:argininosuccinate synthase